MPNEPQRIQPINTTHRYYQPVRTQVPSHQLGVMVDTLQAMLRDGTATNRVADQCQRVATMLNGTCSNQIFPEGLLELSEVLRLEQSRASYQWYSYNWPRGEFNYSGHDGNRIPISNDAINAMSSLDGPNGAYEEYIPATLSVVLEGPMPSAPTTPRHSQTYEGPCEACQALYDSASQAQRTFIEERESYTDRVRFEYPRDENALVDEFKRLGECRIYSEASEGLHTALDDSLGNNLGALWKLARLFILNRESGLDYRRVIRGQIETLDRYEAEIGEDWPMSEPWKCSRCEMHTFTWSADYTANRGRIRSACFHCVNEMAWCDACDMQYEGEWCESDRHADEDDEESYDYDSPSRSGIHDYSYRPNAEFHGSGPLYFGIELEQAVSAGNIDTCARALTNLSNGERAYYLKYDGSVYNGYELVTHPFDLEAWHAWLDASGEESFRSVLKTASQLGARAWNESSCGLHIHASRDGLRSESTTAREAHLYRIVKFVEDNSEPMAKFAGRLSEQWASYDKHRRGISKKEAVKTTGRRSDAYQNRYQAVNLLPRHTIEFRLFRPSLRPETVLAAVELCHGIISHTARLTANACISGGLQFPALVGYMNDNAALYPNALAKVATRLILPTPLDDSETD